MKHQLFYSSFIFHIILRSFTLRKKTILSTILIYSSFFILNPTLNFAQYSVTTYAGSDSGYVNGNISIAKISPAFGMCMDNNGKVTTFAGTGMQGNDDGTTTTATFDSPTGICCDDVGNFYVADFMNHTIRKIDNTGNVTTLAGSGQPGFADGFANEAMFNYPRGIDIDSEGNLYVGDSWNHRIRKITPDGNVTTYAGGGESIGDGSAGAFLNAQDTDARFYTPCGVSVDNFGNVYVADALNHRIRKIDTFGNVTTIAGSGGSGFGNGGFQDDADTASVLNTPTEVFAMPDGSVIFSDTYGQRIRKVTEDGQVITLAGNGNTGLVNGNSASAQFNFPRGIAYDPATEKIYVIDSKNSVIRIIEPQ